MWSARLATAQSFDSWSASTTARVTIVGWIRALASLESRFSFLFGLFAGNAQTGVRDYLEALNANLFATTVAFAVGAVSNT